MTREIPVTAPQRTAAQERRFQAGRYATCPVCFAFRGVQNPRGGDGSMRVMRVHKTKGKWCEGSRMAAIGWEE